MPPFRSLFKIIIGLPHIIISYIRTGRHYKDYCPVKAWFPFPFLELSPPASFIYQWDRLLLVKAVSLLSSHSFCRFVIYTHEKSSIRTKWSKKKTQPRKKFQVYIWTTNSINSYQLSNTLCAMCSLQRLGGLISITVRVGLSISLPLLRIRPSSYSGVKMLLPLLVLNEWSVGLKLTGDRKLFPCVLLALGNVLRPREKTSYYTGAQTTTSVRIFYWKQMTWTEYYGALICN